MISQVLTGLALDILHMFRESKNRGIRFLLSDLWSAALPTQGRLFIRLLTRDMTNITETLENNNTTPRTGHGV
jgi:hypothetical protein